MVEVLRSVCTDCSQHEIAAVSSIESQIRPHGLAVSPLPSALNLSVYIQLMACTGTVLSETLLIALAVSVQVFLPLVRSAPFHDMTS